MSTASSTTIANDSRALPLVRNDTDRLEEVMVCRPTEFQLVAINKIAENFILRGEKPEPDRLAREHEALTRALSNFGATVIQAEPQPGMAYQTFTRDVGVATPEGFLLGRFRYDVRQREEDFALDALIERVSEWRRICGIGPLFFEGGDLVYLGDGRAAIGVGGRTDQRGAEFVKAYLEGQGMEVHLVPFDPEHLHLDMICTVASERVAVLCLDALPVAFVATLANLGFELVPVPLEDVNRMCCNVLALEDGTVLSPSSNRDVNGQMRALGIEVIELEIETLMMGGGGPRCLTLPIRRSLAAPTDGTDRKGN